MKGILIVAVICIAILITIIFLLYTLMIIKVRNTNTKIYKYKEEVLEKDENILIIYQPTKHKTSYKIVSLIKEMLIENNYGYKIHTLDRRVENYDKYKKVIFVVPVYFASVHNEFINKVVSHNFKNLVVIYNGVNKDSNNEDMLIKKYVKKYNKIKLHSDDLDRVKEFIEKEVGLWKR